MANRWFDNVILVDSAMGNLPVVGGSSSNTTNYDVTRISFFFATTAGACIISGANTTNHVANFGLLSIATGNAGITLLQNPVSLGFSPPLRLNSIKCPALTAGSAWIYLA